LDPIAAVTYGWNKFKGDAGTWVLLMLVAFLGAGIVVIVSSVLRSSLGTSFFGFLLGSALSDLLFTAVTVPLQLPLYRAALAVTTGVRPTTDQLTNFDRLGPFFLTELLVGVGVFIGTLLCVLPGIAFAFLAFLAPFFVLSGQEPVDAIKSSVKLVSTNLGPMLLFAVVGFLIYVAGAIACLVGLLVAGPIVLIATAYAFRTAQGQPVAP
jgi:hypothetical protein